MPQSLALLRLPFAVSAMVLALLLAGCGAGTVSAPQSVSAGSSTFAQASRSASTGRRNTQSAGQAGPQTPSPTIALPELPQLPILGAVVPGGPNAHGTPVLPPIKYPENDDSPSEASFRTQAQITQSLATGTEAGTTITGMTLKHFSDTQMVAAGHYLNVVHPSRMVYEATGTFAGPYRIGTVAWNNGGSKVYVIDAKTGDILSVEVIGIPSQGMTRANTTPNQ